MKRKRDVIEAHEAWRVAASELDAAIGIELDSDRRGAPDDVMDIRRFRRALLAERRARLRYVTALQEDNKPIPDDLVWDISSIKGI